ncbi:MAG: ferredoxin--NADP reductase [Bacteroidia bacterium]|nr:ferredoxin--NADP reductase [Bacteroidia bacterium]
MSLRFYPLTVHSVSTETREAYTINFTNPDRELFAYKAGQYLTLKVQVGDELLRRSFSLSSAPHEELLSVTIKALPDGRVSQHLRRTLEPGDRVEVLPPMGKFFVAPEPMHAKHYVLIGCGSGITPLMGMLKAILHLEGDSRITLLYGNRSEATTIFRQQLEELAARHPKRLAVTHVLSQPEGPTAHVGRLEGPLLKSLIQQAQQQHRLPIGYYLCGPEGMMASAKAVLKELGVPDTVVHTEYYSAPVADASEAETEAEGLEYEIVTQNVTVLLEGTETVVTVPPDQSILHAALKRGLDPPYACEEGVCCTCRALLLEGMVAMDEREGLSDEELAAGYILTCQSHPLTADVKLRYG